MFYICIQTKFYIKTFTFVFRQCFIFEYKGKCFIFEYKGKCFISKHLYLNKNKVLYQNIYPCIETKFYIKTFIFGYRLCFISKHLYLNTKINVLYQNIYI